MQIQSLKVNGFKILQGFEMAFKPVEEGDSLTVFLGENGAGKSTVLEVILCIFGGFYSNKIANAYNFDYELKYIYAGKFVVIKRENRYYTITAQRHGEEQSVYKGVLRTLQKNGIRTKGIFPSRLISFYSGANDKLFPVTKEVEKHFKKIWVDSTSGYLRAISAENANQRNEVIHGALYEKKFVHCNDNQLPIYLTALLCEPSVEKRREIAEELGISGEFSVQIELDLLHWKQYLTEGGQYAFDKFYPVIDFVLDEGEGKRAFVNFLYATRNKVVTKDTLILWFDNTSLMGLSQISIYNMLERLSVLFNAKINVTCDNVKPADFSEGQRQLIKILGMLSICKNEECLVLMDEPDAHMNPKWKYGIREFMKNAIDGAINTQVIVATHDPLIINGMEKEDIQIFSTRINEESRKVVSVSTAMQDTIGMGIDALLQSEYYGLQTSYDKETSDKYQKRQLLYIKLINNQATDEEKDELRDLSKELGSLPFSNNTIDFVYDDFIQVYKESEYYLRDYLSAGEIRERQNEMKRIISQLFGDGE